MLSPEEKVECPSCDNGWSTRYETRRVYGWRADGGYDSAGNFTGSTEEYDEEVSIQEVCSRCAGSGTLAISQLTSYELERHLQQKAKQARIAADKMRLRQFSELPIEIRNGWEYRIERTPLVSNAEEKIVALLEEFRPLQAAYEAACLQREDVRKRCATQKALAQQDLEKQSGRPSTTRRRIFGYSALVSLGLIPILYFVLPQTGFLLYLLCIVPCLLGLPGLLAFDEWDRMQMRTKDYRRQLSSREREIEIAFQSEQEAASEAVKKAAQFRDAMLQRMRSANLGTR